jgi:hypothetical protein
MADKKLKAAFKEAAELAAAVPENMRAIAFNRALDMILGVERTDHGAHAAEAPPPPTKRSTEKVVDQSLRVLNMATGVVGMEALTAKQIGKVMEARLGIPVDNVLIGMALDGADSVVDRVMEGGEVLYRLASPMRLLGGSAKPPRKHAAKAKAKAQPDPVTLTPAQVVNELIAKGFFNSARTVRDVLIYLERKGLQFTATQLYPVLMRLIRAGLLAREKTSAGEYQYRAS